MNLRKWITAAFVLFMWQKNTAQSIVINEIITSNSTVITDDDGQYEDWIELYNAGQSTVSLAGYGLSDNSNLFQWVFPDVQLEAGQHLLVWCSDKNRTNPDAPLHTNFKISSAGETLTLTLPSGEIADQVPAVVIEQNTTYGRTVDGAETWIVFNLPTPGTTNFYEEVNPVEQVALPVLSHNSGFYNAEFTLTLSHPNPNAVLYYTLDGSVPNPTNTNGITYTYKDKYKESSTDVDGQLIERTLQTHVYNAPLSIVNREATPNQISLIPTNFSNAPYLPTSPVFKGTVLRVLAVVEGQISQIVNRNFYISPLGNARYSLPVVSLNIDERLYYSYENGLTVAGQAYDTWLAENPTQTANYLSDANYWKSGSSSEIQLNFSYMENGVEILNHDAGLRNQGNGSRHMANRSIRLYAKNSYGADEFNHTFFSTTPHDNFKRIILRNSGNDGYRTAFRDGFVQNLTNHLNFPTQAYQPSVLFINGEYNGIYNLRERYDEYYFKRVYGIEPSELDFLENYAIVDSGDDVHYWHMMETANETNLVDDDNFAYLTTLLDPINYSDYYITNVFIGNSDWPGNNNEYFRKRVTYTPDAPYGQDGRFRWVLKDTDFGFDFEHIQSYTVDHLEAATRTWDSDSTYEFWNNTTLLMRKMLTNETFKTYFINRFADLMNTTFKSEHVLEQIEATKAIIAPEIQEHINRWKIIQNQTIWLSNIEFMRQFAINRPTHQRQHILTKFNLEGTLQVELDVNDAQQGYVHLNTIAITSDTPGIDENTYPWTGTYFKGVPVQLKAIAKPGYEFSHWSGDSDSTEAEITVTLEAASQFVAHFIPAEQIYSPEPLYYWVFDSSLANDTPFTSIAPTYTSTTAVADLAFVSCLTGYPFTSDHENWRTASLERRNSPTEINYIPQANNEVPFAESSMRGVQIKQPFKNGDQENQMVFSLPTTGYKDIQFQFAAKDEGAADAILLDYSITEGNPEWQTDGLLASSYALTSDYQLFDMDFTSIATAHNNPHFKIRLRFDGTDMSVNNGDRVTFNNISLIGTEQLDTVDPVQEQLAIYPNPFENELYVVSTLADLRYEIYSLEGRLVQQDQVMNQTIALPHLQAGMYLLKLITPNQTMVKKIIKK